MTAGGAAWSRLALVIACLLPACTPEPAAPLRIGTNVWPGYEPLYLARELGYFDGDPVRLVEYTSASEVMRAFRNHAIDAAALTLDEVLQLASGGEDLKIVLVMDISSGADVILARPEIEDVGGLKGRRIAAETTALGAYLLTRALDGAGLSPADVTIVPLEVSDHERAFREGKVDAVVTFEPVRSKLLAAGARKIFDSSRIPGEIVDVLAVRTEALQRSERQVRATLSAWFRSLGYLNQNRRQAAEIMARREGIGADQLLASLGGLRFPDRAENSSLFAAGQLSLPATAARLVATMTAGKLIPRAPDVQPLLAGHYLQEGAP